MNLRGGWALIRKSLFSYMSARGFFWTLAVGWLMGPLVYLFVWTTAAASSSLAGFDRGDFVAFYLCLIVVNQFTYPVSNWTVGDVIRTGGFSTWLLRPIPAFYEAAGSDLATKMVCLPFIGGVVLLLGIWLRPSFSLSWVQVLSFVPALLLAMALRFLLAYVLALLALWNDRSDALLALNDTLLFLLGGIVAPTALLPGLLRPVAESLPFRYMVGFPVEVLLGKLNPAQLGMGFAVQLGWLLALLAIHRLVWRRGIKRYTAIGG
jgi:ABC-2 type transport system permease protein